MRVSLRGLFANTVGALPKRQRDYYGFALLEVYKHLEELVAGKHTIQEFADHYGIKQPAKVEEETVS